MSNIDKLLAQIANTNPNKTNSDILLTQNLQQDNQVGPGRSGISAPLTIGSQFDNGIGGNFTAEDILYNRGELQPRLDKWANAFPRLISKVGTEIAKTPAYLYALGEANPWSNTTLAEALNNSWLNTLDSLDKKTKEEFAIYKPKSVVEGNLWDNFTSASFWTDEGVDGVGFLLAMMAPAGALRAANLAGKLTKVGIGVNTAKNLEMGSATLINTALESAAEAKQLVDELKPKLDEQVKLGLITEEQAKIKLGEAGRNSFLQNMTLIAGPNFLMNKNLFSRFIPEKTALSEITDDLGNLVKPIKLEGKELAKHYAKEIGTNVFSEGFVEEGGQFAIEDYNKKLALGLTNKNFIEGFIESYGEALSSVEGQKSILLGGFLGGGASIFGTNTKKDFENKSKLYNLLEENYNTYATSIKSLYKKDADGNITSELDPIKYNQYLAGVIKDNLSSKLKDSYAALNNKEAYDFISNQDFTKFAIPYLQQEGGLDLLYKHLDKFSKQLIENEKAANGLDITLDESKYLSDLKLKAAKLQKVVNSVSSLDVNIETNKQEQLKEFTNKLKNTAIQETSKQLFLTDRINKLNLELAEYEMGLSKDIPQNKVEAEKIKNQISKYQKSLEESIDNYKNIFDKEQQEKAFNEYIQTEKKIDKAVKEEQEKNKAEDITKFAERIANGEQLSSPEDLEFYENNKKAVEEELKNIQEQREIEDIFGNKDLPFIYTEDDDLAEKNRINAETLIEINKLKNKATKQKELEEVLNNQPNLKDISPNSRVKYSGMIGYVSKHPNEDVYLFTDENTGRQYDIQKDSLNNYDNKAYEYGVFELPKDNPITDFIDIEGNKIIINGETYINNYSNPLMAINRDKEGNIISVNLSTSNGKPRTFKKYAEEIAYVILLKTYNDLENESQAIRTKIKFKVKTSTSESNTPGEKQIITREDSEESKKIEEAIFNLEKGIEETKKAFKDLVEDSEIEELFQEALKSKTTQELLKFKNLFTNQSQIDQLNNLYKKLKNSENFKENLTNQDEIIDEEKVNQRAIVYDKTDPKTGKKAKTAFKSEAGWDGQIFNINNEKYGIKSIDGNKIVLKNIKDNSEIALTWENLEMFANREQYPSQERLYRFTEKNKVSGLRLVPITKKNNPSLYEELLKLQDEELDFNNENARQHDKEDSIYFVLKDNKGELIKVDGKPLFSYMTRPERYSKGEILVSKEEVEQLNKLRETILKLTTDNYYFVVSDKSKGTPEFEVLDNGKRQIHSVVGRIVENINDIKLGIATQQAGENYGFLNGQAVSLGKLYAITENGLIDLIPRTLTTKEVDILADLLERRLNNESGISEQIEKLIFFGIGKKGINKYTVAVKEGVLYLGDSATFTKENFNKDLVKQFLANSGKTVTVNTKYGFEDKFTSIDGTKYDTYQEYLLSGDNPLFGTDLKSKDDVQFRNQYLIYEPNLITDNKLEEKPEINTENKEESISSFDNIKAKKADIERRRQEELKGNIVEEVKAYTIDVRGKQYEIYEEKYDKNSSEYFLYVKRDNGEITSVSQDEEKIFNEEGKNKKFLKDDTSEWIDTELQSEINAEYDAKYVDAVKKGEMTKEQAMQALEEVGRKDSKAYAELNALQPTQQQGSVSNKKADLPIGKVGNTEYEVKADGVYYQNKKLDNPENKKTYRQLIEADIERRRQGELKRNKSKEKYEDFYSYSSNAVPTKATGFQHELKVNINKEGSNKVARISGTEGRRSLGLQDKDLETKYSLETSNDEILKDFISKIKREPSIKEVDEDFILNEHYNYSIEVNKINAKYDAELAALQQSKEEGKYTKAARIKRGTGKLDRLTTRTNDTTLLTKEEIDWFKKNLPTVPIEKIQGIINSEAYGQFLASGKVLLSDQAVIGTLYHEAFHVVTQLYLSKTEIDKLYNEASSKFPNKTRKELEEILAEDFAEYKKTGKILGSRPQRNTIFRKLLNFLKDFFGIKASKVEDVYRRLDKGFYANKKRINLKEFTSLNKSLNGKSERFTKDLLDGIDAIFFKFLASQGKTVIDSYKYVEQALNNVHDILTNQFEDETGIFTNLNISEELDEYVYNNWEEISTKWLERMNSLGANIKDFDLTKDYQTGVIEEEPIISKDDDQSVNPDETKKDRSNEGYQEANLISTKSTMFNTSKFMIRSMSMKDKNGNDILSELGLPKTVNFEKTYNFLLRELVGLGSDYNDYYNKLVELSKERPEFKQLTDKLLAPGNAVSLEEILVQNQFVQDFNKNKTTSYITLIEGNRIYNLDATLQAVVERIKDKWTGNLKQLSKQDKETGRLIFDLTKLEGKGNLNYLKELGINFSEATLELLEKNELFNKASQNVRNFVKINKGDITNLFTNKYLKSKINILAGFETVGTSDAIEMSYINSEGQTVYSIGYNNFLSHIKNAVNNSNNITELYQKLPHLKGITSEGSLWLDTLFTKDGKKRKGISIELNLKDGIKDKNNDEGISTRSLSIGDKLVQDINSLLLNGMSSYIRASDKASEFTISLSSYGKNKNLPIPIEDFKNGFNIQELKDIFRNYFKSEFKRIALFEIQGLGKNIDQYQKVGHKWTTFSSILKAETKSKLEEEIKKLKQLDLATIDLKEQLNTIAESYYKEVDRDVIEFFEGTADGKSKGYFFEQKKQLEENKINLQKGISSELSNYSFDQLIRAAIVTDMINSIEQTKLFIGDMAFYKDLFKRTSASTGTKESTRVDEYINKWLNIKNKRLDKKIADGFINTVVLNDVNQESDYLNEYIQSLVESGLSLEEATTLLEAYTKMDEADAQGYITLDEFREFVIRLGKWDSFRENSWEKAQRGEELTAKELTYFLSLKAQYFGPQKYNEDLFAPVYHKYSLMPLIPQLVKGRNLEVLLNKMTENQVGYAVFKSGSKVGTPVNSKGEANNFYTNKNNGEISNEPWTKQIIDYRFLGLQQKSSEPKDKVIFGTQFRKLLFSNLFESSLVNESFPEAKKLLDEYNKIITDLINTEKAKLIKELGIDPTSYTITDATKLVELLKQESKDRALPDNLIEGLQTEYVENKLQLKYKVDTFVNKSKMESLLMSIVNTRLIRQKINGDALIQGASSGFESIGKRKIGSNDTLKFYTKVENNITKEIKEGVDFVFEQNPELATIGTEEQYSQYLDQIFPDSKVKDIVYHGSPTRIDTYDLSKIGSNTKTKSDGIFLTSNPKYAEKYGKEIHAVLINSKNPYHDKNVTTEDYKYFSNYTKKEFIDYIGDNSKDSFILGGIAGGIEEYAVFEPEQIHILGSKQDIEGFKKWISNKFTIKAECMIAMSKNYQPLLDKYGSLDNLNKAIREGKVPEKLLTIVGYRIPTQGLNSIDSFKIKEFLPQSSGTLIVLPTEIVAKSGGDYDIDKLNIFRPKFDKSGEYMNIPENRIIEIATEILTHPSNFNALITPNSTKILTDLVDEIRWIEHKNKKQEEGKTYEGTIQEYRKAYQDELKNIKYTDQLKLTTKTKIFQRFMLAKDMIGIAAIQNTHHILSQINGLSLNKTYYVKDSKGNLIEKNRVISFDYNRGNGNTMEIGKTYDVLGKNKISEVISQIINATVDAAKDPFLFDLNMTLETLSTYCYLIRIGVPFDTVVAFMKQPAISKYLTYLSNNQSLFLGLSNYEAKKQAREAVELEFSTNEDFNLETKVYNTDELKAFLFRENQDSNEFKANQLHILNKFLEYQEHSTMLSDAMKSTNYDTAGLGKNYGTNFLKKQLETKVAKDAFVNNLDKINNSFIGAFNQVDFSLKAYKDLFNIYENEDITKIVQQLIDVIKPFTDEDKIKLRTLIENDFIQYIIQNYSYDNIENIVNDLFIENSVAKELLRIKNNPENEYEEALNKNMLLNELFPLLNSANTGKDNIKIYSRKYDTFMANQLTESFRELEELGKQKNEADYFESGNIEDLNKPTLAQQLMDVGIIQSGLNNSPITYLGIIPYEYYSELVKGGFNNFYKKNGATELYKFQALFLRENPKGIPKKGWIYGKNYDINNKDDYNVPVEKVDNKEIDNSKNSDIEQISEDLGNSKNIQLEIDFQEEQTSGYRNRTIKNASADATLALAIDFNTAGEKLTKSSVLNQNKKYIPIDASSLEVTKMRVDRIVNELNSINKSIVEEFKGFWTREQVAKQTDKVFLFGDNTDDRLNTKYVPSSTQAVIRGLPNAIGIDTKKDRGTNEGVKKLSKKNILTVTPIQAADKKAIVKASIATQYIGFAEGIAGSSTAEYARQISEQSKKVEGINISSRATDKLGKRLTNPNWYAKDLMDVEAPYKANASKIKAPHLNAEEALKYDMNLMYKLQVQKFQKNPELIDEINERGGLEFIKQSSHVIGVKNSRWEGEGMNSNFIKVLSRSYTTVAKELNKFKERNSNIVNSGNYSSSDVIFVSIGGKRGSETIRKQQQDRTIKEALKAIEAGATLITDNKSYVESSNYNEGEKRLAKNLEAKGYNYSEQIIDGQLLGIWSNNTSSYFSDSDFNEFKQQVDEAIQKAKDSGKIIVIPKDGIGTGKAMLEEKSSKLFDYLQQELNKLRNDKSKGITLNIAGNGIYTMKSKYTQEQVDNFTYDLLKSVIENPNLKNKIISIRTGGQTGFDESGAKAGVQLGIPTTILAPKGWTFRNVNGQDISNEEQFKARFLSIQQKEILKSEENSLPLQEEIEPTLESTKLSLKEIYNTETEWFKSQGINKIEDLDTLDEEELNELLIKYCKR